jgi:Fe-S oxidoreductase
MNVRRLLRETQLTARGDAEVLWLCTMCRQCELLCPRGVEVVKVIRELRSRSFSERTIPAALEEALWSLLENDNPLGYPPSQRGGWCEDLSIPTPEEAGGILLYAGSAACYDPRMKRVLQSLARLMISAGVEFQTLGDDERDSGDLVRYVGEKGFLRQVIRDNMATFEEREVETIVAFSPHDYEMFKFVYPEHGGQYEVYHYTEFLAQLIADGRLHTGKSNGEIRVLYHDPCYLSRYGALTQEPREVLHSLPGVVVEEFEDNHANTLCCGGGGGRIFLETEVGMRFSDLRANEAAERGGDAIVTACPFCVQNFEDSLKTQKLEGLQILDLAEFTMQRIL